MKDGQNDTGESVDHPARMLYIRPTHSARLKKPLLSHTLFYNRRSTTEWHVLTLVVIIRSCTCPDYPRNLYVPTTARIGSVPCRRISRLTMIHAFISDAKSHCAVLIQAHKILTTESWRLIIVRLKLSAPIRSPALLDQGFTLRAHSAPPYQRWFITHHLVMPQRSISCWYQVLP